MRFLLDTNILLPIIDDDVGELDRHARTLIERQSSDLSFSVASLWEIAIKWRLGKLKLKKMPVEHPGLFMEMGLSMLDVTADHALVEIDPAPATRDPFDRLLLGVCAVEGMRLVTTDRALQEHPLSWCAMA